MFTVNNFSDDIFNDYYYYISYFSGKNALTWDNQIARLLDMNTKTYRNLLISFGAEPGVTKQSDVKFYNEDNAKNAVEYLNEKYGVLLKLKGN